MIDNIWTYRTRHFLSRCRQERDKTMLIRTHVSFGDEILMSPCIFARRSCFPPIMSTSATSCTPHGEDVTRYYICTLSSFLRRSPLLGSKRNEKTLDYIRNETSAAASRLSSPTSIILLLQQRFTRGRTAKVVVTGSARRTLTSTN